VLRRGTTTRIGRGDLMELISCRTCGTLYEGFTPCPTCYEIAQKERIEQERQWRDEECPARETQQRAEDLAQRGAEERARLLDRQLEEEQRIADEEEENRAAHR
jgi:uncharacterized Zn finger protein (UPF0148 family)